MKKNYLLNSSQYLINLSIRNYISFLFIANKIKKWNLASPFFFINNTNFNLLCVNLYKPKNIS